MKLVLNEFLATNRQNVSVLMNVETILTFVLRMSLLCCCRDTTELYVFNYVYFNFHGDFFF